MDYEQFLEQVKADLQEAFPYMDVQIRSVEKLQGESYTGISITPIGSNAGATMDLRQEFQLVQEEMLPLKVSFARIERLAADALERIPQVDQRALEDYAQMKDTLIMQAVPIEPNRALLETIPHKTMEDIAIVYRFQLDHSERGDATVLVTNQMLKNYGITAEQLIADAEVSAPQRNPLSLPYDIFGLICTNIGEAWRLAEGADYSAKVLSFFSTIGIAFGNPLPSFYPADLLVGLIGGAGLRLAVFIKSQNKKNYKHNVEYGSARWGTHADIEPFMYPVFENNVILTRTERLMMSNRPKNPANARNKNVLIVGGSGSGKTRFWIKPNLLQLHSSYVLTDPKGTTLIEVGHAFVRAKYRIKIFNTINFQKSMHYNPFAYVHSEKDILKLVTTLMANTKGEGKGSDPFWDKAETLLYCALIGYIHYEAPVEEQNFATLIEFINAMEVREDDEEYQNPVDLMFEALKKKNPDHFAVRQYAKFKLAAGKTAKSILISCGARLAVFDIQELREITAYDELELDTIGDRKTALFLIMSDTDATFNFLISMIYTQLFNLLCEKADDVYGGRLPVHVRCLIDEAANIGQIPNLEKLVATIRSREISACLVLQARSQLKAIYKDNADTIIGNMDSQVFLGGSEPTTLKELAEALGKETIDTFNTSDTRGNSPSYGTNYQKLGKDLMSKDEISVMDGSKCILQLRGVRPFLSDKYDITQHPNYKYTSDFDKKYTFDIEKYLNRRMRLKAEDEYEVISA